MLAFRLPRRRNAGAVTLLLCATMLLLVVLIAAGTLHMLLGAATCRHAARTRNRIPGRRGRVA
ncbi:hypothetical protein [Cupriavidus sp. SK-4]|uniref:hypothetical protein n=1 Tax=Cupriavidus sp. SK-4 TaxID=574750 RepID=UPI001F210B6F|nr:hypothetical protein [Cupriavidus sp. SK-4]